MTSKIIVRLKKESDNEAVAILIRDSLNVWYREHFGIKEVVPSVAASSVFTRVYDELDPNCCVVAERRNQTLRLVSSAMNLDSFSLYNRFGFVPRVMFQDMTVAVPEEGFPVDAPEGTLVREATLSDVDGIVALESSVYGIERAKDYRYFIENRAGIWGVSVLVSSANGEILGVMCSVNDPGSAMVGPGATRTDEQAAALIRYELNRYRGAWSPVFLIPTDAVELRKAMYSLGAVNTETHVAQSRGPVGPKQGVVIPSFMPETA